MRARVRLRVAAKVSDIGGASMGNEPGWHEAETLDPGVASARKATQHRRAVAGRVDGSDDASGLLGNEQVTRERTERQGRNHHPALERGRGGGDGGDVTFTVDGDHASRPCAAAANEESVAEASDDVKGD